MSRLYKAGVFDTSWGQKYNYKRIHSVPLD